MKLIALFSGKPKLVFVSSKCFIFVLSVISPANDEIPATSKLLTSKPTVLIPTVTIPAETGVTVIGVVKLNVPAVPTVLPSSFTITPVPDAVTPVNPEPSPKYFVAVTKPAILTLSKFV